MWNSLQMEFVGCSVGCCSEEVASTKINQEEVSFIVTNKIRLPKVTMLDQPRESSMGVGSMTNKIQ